MAQPAKRRPPLLPAILLLLPAAGCTLVGRSGPGGREAKPTATAAVSAEATPAGRCECRWEVRFSPDGGCTEAIVSAIETANQKVRVQAYHITSAPIARALEEAHARGIDVQMIVDEEEREKDYSVARDLARGGIPVWVDAGPGLAHNKVIVIDGSRVVTGSFNFTKAAETTNRENVLLLQDPELAAAYEANWERDRRTCEPYAVGR